MISIGFTGTRHGMTMPQYDALERELVLVLLGGDSHAHHGDCIGADAEFHDIATRVGAYTVKHPGPFSPHSAFCEADWANPPMPHMVRNRKIVSVSTVMFAAPAEATEQPRGGTWSTVRFARKAGKPLAIVWPDGSVTRERWAL